MKNKDLIDKYAPSTNGKKEAKPAEDPKPAELYKLPAKLPDIWYQAAGNRWWLQDDAGNYTEYPTSHVRAMLLHSGIRGSIIQGERLSPVDLNLLSLRQKNVIVWAGQLAGFDQGICEICGSKILVTKGAKRIKAKSGKWNTLKRLLGELLGDDVEWFYGWIKSALRAMYAGSPFRPGQCLAIAGKRGCGKSLLQSLITEILGGRAAKPFQWLMGETNFNEDLFASEHLILEDEACAIDIRKRVFFGSQLKNLVANDLKRCHPKGAKGVYLQAFWRVSISLNDEPESLLVLPPINDDNSDKIILLHAWQASFPYGTDDLKSREKYRQQLSSELPAFLDFLHSWRIPRRMADKRYGVKGYQCEDLIEQLHCLQPEYRLLDLVDHLNIWDGKGKSWEGTASQLQDQLEEKDSRGRVAKLLSWHSACGQFLGKLAKTRPKRVQMKNRKDGQVIWRIIIK